MTVSPEKPHVLRTGRYCWEKIGRNHINRERLRGSWKEGLRKSRKQKVREANKCKGLRYGPGQLETEAGVRQKTGHEEVWGGSFLLTCLSMLFKV